MPAETRAWFSITSKVFIQSATDAARTVFMTLLEAKKKVILGLSVP